MRVAGQLFLSLGFLSSLIAIGALFWGRHLGPKKGEAVTNAGYIATFVSAAGYTLSTLAMTVAFFSKDFTLLYVASNHSTDVSSLAWLYTLSGVWAGREGSLLFWAWLLALFMAWVAYQRMDKTDDLSNMGIAVTNIVLSLFGVAMMFSEPNNPFKPTPAEWLSGGQLVGQGASMGMNPLLQHWAMILHPPTLFIGYAGLTIPFAFAIAALIVNDASKAWVVIVDRITVFSWLFLGAGIGLGSVWAYVVLGWGGYWAWDPVENASLLPWLTGVALIHSFTVYRRRDGFKRWAIMSAALTFALVILGTFITRSGIVQSVHAFQKDPVSLFMFLGMIIGSVLVAGIGLALRWETFAGNDEFESLTSKDAAYYFNNVIMTVAGLLVAYMTVTSALPAWLPFGGQSMSAVSYDLLARPIGVVYVFILAVCPLLSWKKTDPTVFWARLKWPLVATVALFALLVWEWVANLRPIYLFTMAQGGENARKLASFGPEVVYDVISIAAFLAAALVISTATFLFIDGSRKRAAAKGESFFASLGTIMFKSRTQSGGYLSHLGMGIIMIGLVGSSMYVRDVRLTVPETPGAQFKVDNYDFTFQGIEEKTLPNGDVVAKATFGVEKNGRSVGTVDPGLTQFARQDQTRLDAKVLMEPLRDIFVVWEGSESGQMSVNVKVNPLIAFAWGGFAILMLGSALAAWPKKVVVAAPVARPLKTRKA
ncbi:MAG: cytochrome c biogenesis protein CcsA [Coriobacteriia bacterium]|nr:cytochrome c biogenesis protein CcsA [Coriobacteriia bacterium]